MQREIGTLPLEPQLKQRLHLSGFMTVEDVISEKPCALSSELGMTQTEALTLLEMMRSHVPSQKHPHTAKYSNEKTALEMIQDEQSRQGIVTFCQQLDDMLGGGIPLTKITEVCGAPGIGKTQLSMQVSVDVQIPQCFGGLEGEAVYVDTEGSFIVDRVVDIAQATVAHCQQLATMSNSEEQEICMKSFSMESVLKGIHYFRCHDHIELIALSYRLTEFVKEHPKVKLIVVDSIAFPFRHDMDDYSLRTRLLNGLAQSFIRLASQNKLAVLLTNQMTTKLGQNSGENSYLVPALGESWGHASTVRLILYWKKEHRHALLYKSPSHREMKVPYQITTGGIRDVPSEVVDHEKQNEASRKRPRLDS